MNKPKLLIAATMATLVLTACQHEFFQKQRYVDLVAEEFPVKDFDAGHTWATARELTMSVILPSADSYEIYMLTGNPAVSTTRLLQHVKLNGANRQSVNVSCPTVLSELWIAVVDAAGEVKEARIAVGTDDVNVTADLSQSNSRGSTPAMLAGVSPQPYTFCFEDAFPKPGDYDFNDLVMGVQLNKRYAANTTDPDTLIISTDLKAVGTVNPIGAAMRLKGVNTAVVGTTYEAENTYPYYKYGSSFVPTTEDRKFIEKTSEVNPANRDVCIPLFCDAHYAISKGSMDNAQQVVRCYYNTMTDEDMAEVATTGKLGMKVGTVKREFRVLFDQSSRASFNDFNMMDLDLFAVTSYNGGYFETHTMTYKADEVIHQYINGANQEVYSKNYIWALLVAADFSYAREGKVIGTLGSNGYEGAYCTPSHSFFDWGRDRYNARDWYLYPDNTNTYR